MIRRGFTLIELMIVIIIIGILSTIAIGQYTSQVEKSRGAEAKSIIGTLKTECAVYYTEFQTTRATAAGFGCTNDTTLGLNAPGVVLNVAHSNYYFIYSITTPAINTAVFTARRCPNGSTCRNPLAVGKSGSLNLTVNYDTGGTGIWVNRPGSTERY